MSFQDHWPQAKLLQYFLSPGSWKLFYGCARKHCHFYLCRYSFCHSELLVLSFRSYRIDASFLHLFQTNLMFSTEAFTESPTSEQRTSHLKKMIDMEACGVFMYVAEPGKCLGNLNYRLQGLKVTLSVPSLPCLWRVCVWEVIYLENHLIPLFSFSSFSMLWHTFYVTSIPGCTIKHLNIAM